jgi:hypothetical protein
VDRGNSAEASPAAGGKQIIGVALLDHRGIVHAEFAGKLEKLRRRRMAWGCGSKGD